MLSEQLRCSMRSYAHQAAETLNVHLVAFIEWGRNHRYDAVEIAAPGGV